MTLEVYQVNLFARAAAGLNLTPGERAFLKFLSGVGISAGMAAATAAISLVSSHGGAVDVKSVAIVGGVAFATSAIAALKKYATANFESLLGTTVGQLANDVEQKLNDVKIPFQAPTVPATVNTNVSAAPVVANSGV